MKPYLERLKDGVLIFDGAMATYLFTKGIYLKKCFEEVCLTHPQMVLDVHREYIDCGAQAIETNTYGANPIKLKGFNLSEKTEQINQEAVLLARKAAENNVYVAGSVGPCGQILEPQGPLTIDQARMSFRAHIGALIRAGVDFILLETFLDRKEMQIAIETVKEFNPEMPIQAQFTFSRSIFGGEEYYSQEAIAWAEFFETQPVDVVGINLMGPSDALDALSVLKKKVTKPLAVMPDSGFPKEVDGRQFYLTSPDFFADYAKLFLDAGAVVIGGCCGTTPAHIEKIASAVLNFDSGRRKSKWTEETQVLEKEETPFLERSSLSKDLAMGCWISMVELVSPLGTDLSSLVEKAKQLEAGGVRYVNFPDGPRASARISALLAAIKVAQETHLEPILHVACRDKNLIGLQGDLFGYHAFDLRNLLLVTGDPPKVGKYPNVTGVFDVDSVGLTKVVSRYNRGIDAGGEALPVQTSFVHGTGVNPSFPIPEKELERAWLKAQAGTEYFVTQPVWDTDQLEGFLKELKKIGKPIILGIWPLASYRNAVFLNTEVPGVSIPQRILDRMAKWDDKENSRQDGVKISREIISQFRADIQGIQVSPPFGNVKTALEVVSGWE